MANQKRAATTKLSNRVTNNLETDALKNASSEYFPRAVAGYIKKWSLRLFTASLIALLLLGVGETVLMNLNLKTGELYEDTFEICKTISSTLLGFTFASKLDDLLK